MCSIPWPSEPWGHHSRSCPFPWDHLVGFDNVPGHGHSTFGCPRRRDNDTSTLSAHHSQPPHKPGALPKNPKAPTRRGGHLRGRRSCPCRAGGRSAGSPPGSRPVPGRRGRAAAGPRARPSWCQRQRLRPETKPVSPGTRLLPPPKRAGAALSPPQNDLFFIFLGNDPLLPPAQLRFPRLSHDTSAGRAYFSAGTWRGGTSGLSPSRTPPGLSEEELPTCLSLFHFPFPIHFQGAFWVLPPLSLSREVPMCTDAGIGGTWW